MSSVPGLRPLAPAAVKAMLDDDAELALVDVREELIFSQNHLLWARSVPLSRTRIAFRTTGAAQNHAHHFVRR